VTIITWFDRYIVHANDKYTYPNVYILSMSSPYHSHKANMFPDVIVLDPSITFQIYDLISCDISSSKRIKRNKNENRKGKQKIKEKLN